MRTIPLHPVPEAEHDCLHYCPHYCPHCHQPLKASGWLMPGMRCLADLSCSVCGREFYGDLASGQALYSPMLLEKKDGLVHDKYQVEWFAQWLRDSYLNRTDARISFTVEERRQITRPVVLLNCLDTLYGHSVLKLLNAEYHLASEVDLVVIVPSFLAWMVSEGVAQVWVVGLPLKRGTEWNDWLAGEIHRRVEAFEAVSLSQALSHPHPVDFHIENFTGVKPFPLDEWERRLERPTVTFIWRDDRTWQIPKETGVSANLKRLSAGLSTPASLQRKLVIDLAEALRRELPKLDFAIAGLSDPGTDDLPAWIEDLRFPAMTEELERRCCERYAASHVVVGVHGSNMLLPSAHAGSVVELIGPDRWGNFLQDILLHDARDSRDALFRYRFLPDSSHPETVAQLITSLLKNQPAFRRLMNVPGSKRLVQVSRKRPSSQLE